MTLTIEMKWKAVARVAIAALESGTEDGRRLARKEIMRMADVADLSVDLQNELMALRGEATR